MRNISKSLNLIERGRKGGRERKGRGDGRRAGKGRAANEGKEKEGRGW